jgi:hypothetical protein
MPRYDYHCPSNGLVVEVRHGISEKLLTWAEVCARAGVPPGDTDPAAPVERVIHAPALAFPRGDAALKGMGFTKLVRRDDGVYENVTAAGGEPKVVSSDDPGSISKLGLAKKLGD